MPVLTEEERRDNLSRGARSPETAATRSSVSLFGLSAFRSTCSQKGIPKVKKFADMMIADHTKTSSELKSMTPAEMQGAIPACSMTPRTRSSASCGTPNRRILRPEYDSMQVSAHKDAVSLFEPYAGRRQSQAEGLGLHHATGSAASPRDGAVDGANFSTQGSAGWPT